MSKLLNTFSWVLTIIFILITVFFIGSIIPNGPYKVAVVRSGSMEPAIATGSLVTYVNTGNYQIGDTVAFDRPNSGENIVTIHRIIRAEEIEGQTTFFTKGDANEDEDNIPLTAEEIRGKVFLPIPLLGYGIGWLKVQPAVLFILLIPISLLIYHELSIFRQKRAEKNDKGNPSQVTKAKKSVESNDA